MSDKVSVLDGLASIALHVAVLVLLFITIPIFSQSHALDIIKVELIPSQTPSSSSPESVKESAEDTAALKAFETASNEEKEKSVIEPVIPLR